ncbi:AAA family ATPase [Ceratobasidium sp. AG-Ba]|nr:AAA family ATPase [Ceratobasidium sp. AG-Ba]
MSFSQTSSDIKLEDSTVLVAQCKRNGASDPTTSRLDLDRVLGNVNGSFRWGEKSFSDTSSDFILDGTILRATLRKSNGERRRDHIDLNECIANVNGQLVYVSPVDKHLEDTTNIPLPPSALEHMWSSPFFVNVESSALPVPGNFENTLSQLRISLLSKTQRKAVHVAEGSKLVEPALALFCPIEGGEYVVDATVKQLAEKTNSEVQVVDMAQVAAGEWGAFGKAASGFRLKENPLGKVKSIEELGEDDDGEKNIKGLEIFWQKIMDSKPPTSESESASRSRIVYIRDFGLLAPRVDTWFPPLYSALRSRRTNALGPESPITHPTTVVFGVCPRVSSILPELVKTNEWYYETPSPKEWDESSTKDRAARLKKLKEKLDSGKLLDDLPAFTPQIKILKPERPKVEDVPKEAEPKKEEALAKEETAPAKEAVAPTEGEATSKEGEDAPKEGEAVSKEQEAKPKEEEAKPKEEEKKTEAASSQSEDDLFDKYNLDGYFRSCIIAPAKRDAKLERAARENRRKELNELMVRMAVGIQGGEVEAGAAPVPPKEETSDKDDKEADKSKEEDKDKKEKEEKHMMQGWHERLLDSSSLKEVVDRAIELAMIANEDDEQDPVKVTWAQLQEAWQLAKNGNEGLKAWAKSTDDGDEKKDDEKGPVDEIVEKVKKEDLDEYEQRLLPCIVDIAKLSTTFENVHLPSQVIDSVRSIVSLPLLYPEAFKSGILKQQAISGALLFGPPGTGKTHVVRALAKESGARMMAIKPSDIADKYVGETEKLVNSLFKLARRLKPCVVFIDEIDSIMGARTSKSCSGGSRWHTSMLTEFMQEMDGLIASSVIVIGATNRPFDIDDAVLRRLPCRLLVDLPGVEAREEILKIMLKDDELASDVNVSELARKTDRFSGSDLKNLCVAAAMDALKETVKLPWVSKSQEPKETAITGLNGLPINKLLAKTKIASEKDSVKSESSDDESSVQTSDPNSESPSSPSSGATTPEEKPEPLKPRILSARHFTRALMDVAPSSSESQGSLSELRKWNTQFGTGTREQPRPSGSLPYSYGGAKSSVPGSSSVPGANSIPNYSSTGLGSSGLGSSGLGSTRLGSSSLGGLGSSGLGSSSLGSLTGKGGVPGSSGSGAYPPSTYTPPSLGGASPSYTSMLPGSNLNIPGYTPSVPGGSSAPGS